MKDNRLIVKKHPAQMMGWHQSQHYPGPCKDLGQKANRLSAPGERRAHQGPGFYVGSKAPIVQRYRVGKRCIWLYIAWFEDGHGDC